MNRSIFLASILLCISTTSVAESIAETRLTLSPTLLYFDYTEFSTTDQELDNESGWLPGLEAKLSQSITTDWSFDIYSSYYSGTVDYDGQTQSGVPHTTDSGTKLFRFGGRIKKVIYKNARFFIGAQSHKWQRDIKDNNNVSGIDETYKWIEYSIGENNDFFISQTDVINLEIAFLIISEATIDVDLSRVNLGSTTLDLGNGIGPRVKLSWNRQYDNNTRYGLGLFFEAWNFGRSNTKLTQGGSSIVFVTEPRSETRNIGLQFNIEYIF